MPDLTRRDLLKASAAASLVPGLGTALIHSNQPALPFVNILRHPDLVRVMDKDQKLTVLDHSGDRWRGAQAEVTLKPTRESAKLTLHGTGVTYLHLRWHGDLSGIKLCLGDHWERSYADLEWRGVCPNRVMPWYAMVIDGDLTHGYGVRTGASGLCFWTVDTQGISLWIDVRSGGLPADLSNRTIEVAEILCREGKPGESSFDATRAFCQQMSPNPLIPDKPVYGTNDWNFAYGNSSADLILGVASLISELSPNQDNRPYSVIDEGWQMGPYNNRFGYGPWEGNPHFGDMAVVADKIKKLNVRPGLWYRPLTPLDDSPQSWRSQRNKGILDPTNPEVLDHITKEIQKFVGWGYEMIKHDFSTWDICGRWGFQMGPSPTNDGWTFQDPTKTTAEVIKDLYQTIRTAAGKDCGLIGCNVMGHLSAGTHKLQRIGDDTSGRSWNRNRRMGVNTLAFRAPQHGVFFECDPDIVSITKLIPWELVHQWLRLVSESGQALFVAIDPAIVEENHRVALRKAFEIAAKRQPVGHGVDWTTTQTPRTWKLGDQTAKGNNDVTKFAWMDAEGPYPFGD